MLVYLNDRLVPEEEAVVSVFDHGFLYGDGVYETMRSYGGVVFRLDEHLRRLGRSAGMIGLGLPADAPGMKRAVYEAIDGNRLKDAYVRLTVSRGRGPLGLDPGLCPEPTFVVMAGPLREAPAAHLEAGISLITARTRRNLKEALDPAIKSLNFLNNIMAKAEAVSAGADEALMLNHRGHVAECTVSNVFFFSGGALCTPSVSCGILDGITRTVVIGLAGGLGIGTKEGEFLPADLRGADEVFVTNTTMEVMPVGLLDGTRHPVGEKTMALRKAYGALAAEETAKGRR